MALTVQIFMTVLVSDCTILLFKCQLNSGHRFFQNPNQKLQRFLPYPLINFQISVDFGWDFGRNDDLINSFCIWLTFMVLNSTEIIIIFLFKIGDLHRHLQSSKCWEKSSWISNSSPHFLTLFHHLCCANNFNSHQKTSNWNWGQYSSTQAKTYEVRSDRNIPTK